MNGVSNNAVSGGGMNGHVRNTKSSINVSKINIEIDRETAWALCNVLSSEHITQECVRCLDNYQHKPLVSLGSALAALIDHPNRGVKELSK